MPVVRCPDCFREITLSPEDMSRVIECSTCEARFGPLAPPPPPSAAPPPPPAPPAEVDEDDSIDADPSKPRVRRKRVKPKSGAHWLPIVLGIFIGLAASAALIGAIYVLVVSRAVSTHATDQSP
jgi:hypothetical protein